MALCLSTIYLSTIILFLRHHVCHPILYLSTAPCLSTDTMSTAPCLSADSIFVHNIMLQSLWLFIFTYLLGITIFMYVTNQTNESDTFQSKYCSPIICKTCIHGELMYSFLFANNICTVLPFYFNIPFVPTTHLFFNVHGYYHCYFYM